MPYIVKSSLDIGGKIIPWNEQEANKLIKEKEKMLEKKLEIQEEAISRVTPKCFAEAAYGFSYITRFISNMIYIQTLLLFINIHGMFLK